MMRMQVNVSFSRYAAVLLLLLSIIGMAPTSSAQSQSVFDRITDLSWNSENTLLAIAGSCNHLQGVHLFDHQGNYIESFATTDRVLSVSWSADGTRIATYSSERMVSVWDVATGRLINAFEEIGAKDDHAIYWHPQSGNNTIATELVNSAFVYDSSTGVLEARLTSENNIESISTLAWNRDGSQMFTRSDDDRVRAWDVATSAVVGSVQVDGAMSLQLSPDGDLLAIGSWQNTITLVNSDTLEIITTLNGLTDNDTRFEAVRWNSDATRIVGSGYRRIIIWDAQSGAIIDTITVIDEQPITLDALNAVEPLAVDYGPDDVLTYIRNNTVVVNDGIERNFINSDTICALSDDQDE